MKNHSPIDSDISPQDISTCLAVLNALAAAPEQCVRPGSTFAEVQHSAARLTKAVKRRLRAEFKDRDDELVKDTGIRQDRKELRAAAEADRPPRLAAASVTPHATIHLSEKRHCYVCKNNYTELHHHYDCMCPGCGELNFAKRTQTADLNGMTAVVTGGRVKIGFRIALMLLRAGASLIVTSRFPIDAAMRYSREDDFADWKDRLNIFGVDFRHLPSLEDFVARVTASYDAVDIIINNSAQTIRRPPVFYEHVWEAERAALPYASDHVHDLIANADFVCEAMTIHKGISGLEQLSSVFAEGGGHISAALSQVPLLPDDHLSNDFPVGQLDEHGQQIDLRSHNSWIAKVPDVSFVELLEVHAVNTFAPFFILQGLDELLMRHPDRDRFVVNVSAMEGRFNHFKDGRHPHTNMAKAALNMLTRSCADDYATRRIFMNSVDTGWVTNEFPHSKVAEMKGSGFEPPLDETDGAARVCDAVFTAVNGDSPLYGKFLKDYRTITW